MPNGKPIQNWVPPQRFWDKVEKTGTCWNWTGAKIPDGYGVFRVDSQTVRLAHRLMYTAKVGDIPAKLDLDHLCRNRSCVNPDHLEAVTNRVNGLRGNVGLKNRDKIKCKQGHPFTPENTGTHGGRRYCKTCRRLWTRKYRAAAKQQPLATPREAA